jgi:hypothetical protein
MSGAKKSVSRPQGMQLISRPLRSMYYQKYLLTLLTTMYILGININFKGEG